MRLNQEGSLLVGMKVLSGFKLQHVKISSTAAVTLEAKVPPVVLVDPSGAGAAIDVVLPASPEGGELLIIGDLSGTTGETLTVKDGATTVGTVGLNSFGIFWNDGATWYQVV